MKLRIARKICRYMGYGYPIENTQRLNTAVHVWDRAQKRLSHFMRDVKKEIADEPDMVSIDKAYDAYCKVCGHFPHTVPTHICRHNCEYFSDFKRYIKGE